jgi:hypothetical protein
MYYKYLVKRYKKLTEFDVVRRLKLIQIIQYTILYTLIAIPLSAIIEYLFPEPDENKNKLMILFEILLQMVFLGIVVFYVQKIIRLVPFIFMSEKALKKRKILEYGGEVTIGLIFVGTQNNLFEKVHILRRYITDNLFGKSNLFA